MYEYAFPGICSTISGNVLIFKQYLIYPVAFLIHIVHILHVYMYQIREGERERGRELTEGLLSDDSVCFLAFLYAA